MTSVKKMKKIRLKQTQKSITVRELAVRLSDSGRAPARSFDHNTFVYDLADLAREKARCEALLDRVAAELSEILGKPVDATTDLTLEELATWRKSKDGIEIEQERMMSDMPSDYEIALQRVLQRNNILQPRRAAEQTTDSAPPTDTGLSKRERQIRAIEAGADALHYTRTAIPDGGKKAIMDWCKSNDPSLFGAGDAPFTGAGKEASKDKRVTMANRAKFAGE